MSASEENSVGKVGFDEPKKSYLIDDKLVFLKSSHSLYAIRTEDGCQPYELLSQCLDHDLCSDENIVDYYPEASVWVYRLAVESTVSVAQLKKRVRALNDSRLTFIGSVWRDENSQIYQLYTGNLFVKFSSSISAPECKLRLREWGLTLKRKLGFSPNTFFVEPTQSHGFDAFDWATELNSKAEVKSCQPELVVSRKSFRAPTGVTSFKADPDRTWIHRRVEIKKAWQFGRGAGVKICIIDDGIEAEHPAFQAPGKIVAAKDMLESGSVAAGHRHSSELHGTACASVAASSDPNAFGTAPDSQLIAIRSKGLGSVLEADAIYWAVSQGADIISCSWGPSDGDIDDPLDDFPSLPLPTHTKLALEYAATQGRNGKGCLVVFAAGNGRERVSLDSYASNPNVIAVGASNRQDNLSRYSDRGSPLFCVFPSSEIEVSEAGYQTAYGVTVADRLGELGYADGDYFAAFGGTSAAAPGVAGVAALVLQNSPELSLSQLKQALIAGCEKIGGAHQYDNSGRSEEFGYGLLNANKAVQAARLISNSSSPCTDNAAERKNRLAAPLPEKHLTSHHVYPTSSSLGELPMHTVKNQAYALHIGIDVADPTVYKDFRPLAGCVNDAKAMASITSKRGFFVETLFNKQATRQRIKAQLHQLTLTANAGDLVVVSYAGHGSFVEDKTHSVGADEPIDEVLVTYDGLLIDDEIYNIFSNFKPGVRVVWVADCCHAESNLRAIKLEQQSLGINSNSRELPMSVATRVLEDRLEFYQSIQNDLNRQIKDTLQAAVIGLYACAAHEQAQESNGRGAFTQRIEMICDAFRSDYSLQALLDAVAKPISATQNPNVELLGKGYRQFENGVFQLSGANIVVPANVFANLEETSTNTALESPGTTVNEGFETSTQSTFIVVEKEGEPSVKLGSDTRMLDTQHLRLIDNELPSPVQGASAAWDKAYEIALSLESADDVEFIEPDVVSNIYQPPVTQALHATDSRGGGAYLASYPNPEHEKYREVVQHPFIWHLEEEYSQLRPAFEKIKATLPEQLTQEQINELPLICHIDTGVYPDHPSLPKFFDAEKSRTFTRFGSRKDATDVDKSVALIENQGHGHGTVSILAGDRVGLAETQGKFKGYVGAFPYARVMTLKISEHVVLLSGGKFARAIRHAIDAGASVVTMSMAGAPSRSMLKAINKAYEAGVVVVSAAGNSWVEGGRKLLPKHTMYPARFNRVIGVTGATLDKTPYLVGENQGWQTREVGGASMQTCFGPEEASSTNIAAYTPNVQWAGQFDGALFNPSGGGTSSATPQVAAAAAMYMYVHRKELANITEPALRAEITRQALFQSAQPSDSDDHNKVFGTGLLKARDALALKPSDVLDGLKPAPKDKLGWFISDDIFKQLFNIRTRGVSRAEAKQARNRRDLVIDMLRTELAQLCYLDPKFEGVDKQTPINELCARVMQSEKASLFLKRQLKTVESIDVPLDQQRTVMFGANRLKSSYVVRGEKGQRLLVSAVGCGFSTVKHDISDDDVVAQVEINPVATRGSSAMGASMNLDIIGGENAGPALIIERDSLTGEEIYRWMMPKQSGVDSRSVLASEQGQKLSLPVSANVNGRGPGAGFKQFVVKIYRTASDQALSDLPGLIVGKSHNGEVVWQKRTAAIDRQLRQQSKTLMLVHGTFSSVEVAFESLTSDAKFLNEVKRLGFGDYFLAYNMSTIRSSVNQNVRALKTAITKLKLPKAKSKLSVIAHSRGCLVARKAFSDDTKMVLLAGTHHGTPMADGEYLGALVNRISNLAALAFTSSATLPLFLKGISRLIQFTGEAKGLADQRPDSTLTRSLIDDFPMSKAQLLVAANFEPSSSVLRRLDDAAVDMVLFRGMENDGVTPVKSALAKLDTGRANIKLLSDSTLHHLNLFSDKTVKSVIIKHLKS